MKNFQESSETQISPKLFLSFEPNPQLQRLLDESIKYNRTKNITLHRFALGQEENVLELKYRNNHSGGASLVNKYEGNAVKVKVPIRPLSTVLSELGITKIRLVKIDVEGFEPQVLRGAYEAFAANPPDAIIIELRPNDINGSIENHPTIKILQKLGYDFLCLPQQGLTTIRPRYFNPKQSQYFGTDLLASPHGRIFEEIASLVDASL